MSLNIKRNSFGISEELNSSMYHQKRISADVSYTVAMFTSGKMFTPSQQKDDKVFDDE